LFAATIALLPWAQTIAMARINSPLTIHASDKALRQLEILRAVLLSHDGRGTPRSGILMEGRISARP
jgi:hypothetical protein